MNFENIKTENNYKYVSDILYKRAHSLRYIWLNVNESEQRKNKAFMLWLITYNRIMKLIDIYNNKI